MNLTPIPVSSTGQAPTFPLSACNAQAGHQGGRRCEFQQLVRRTHPTIIMKNNFWCVEHTLRKPGLCRVHFMHRKKCFLSSKCTNKKGPQEHEYGVR